MSDKEKYFLDMLYNMGFNKQEMIDIFDGFSNLFLEKDQEKLLNYEKKSKKEYYNFFKKILNEYTVIDYTEFVDKLEKENPNITIEEIGDEMRNSYENNKTYVRMMWDRDAVLYAVDKVNKFWEEKICELYNKNLHTN